MLAPRRPDPQDFPKGDRDPAYSQAVSRYKEQLREMETHPERWGGKPREQPQAQAAPTPQIG